MPYTKVTEAQILGTRECNIRCDYCRLVRDIPFERKDELDIDGWKTAFSKMDSFGIKTVKGLGGEWSVKEYLPELVEFITNNTNIKFALLSNSSFDNPYRTKLVDGGLNSYFASVDWADPKILDSNGKSAPGLKMLLELKELGVENLGANTVIMPQNIDHIPQILEFLTENEIVMNLCPAHGGDNYAFEYRAKTKSGNIANCMPGELEELVDTLFDMKDDGCFFAAPASYLDAIKTHAIPLDWKCGEFSQLRIDANGDLKICPDGGPMHYVNAGIETNEKYNILSMSPNDFRDLYASFDANKWRARCPGCGPWSAQYRAEKNKRYGIGDPVLSGRKNR
ncbi:MAG: radical SAM protein [Candidatus Aenigmarchaeota archaeon]|nr:radical SAM protein [Candidatus Aenigmarchaeota archaeon]